MGRNTLAKSKTLIRELKRGQGTRSYFNQELVHGRDHKGKDQSGRMAEELRCWMPHPRTGIYYPEGCEWVMEDIPKGAASFHQTCWHRSLEGVEKPTPDSSSTSDIFDHPFLNI